MMAFTVHIYLCFIKRHVQIFFAKFHCCIWNNEVSIVKNITSGRFCTGRLASFTYQYYASRDHCVEIHEFTLSYHVIHSQVFWIVYMNRVFNQSGFVTADSSQHGDSISISKCFEGFTVSEKLESDNSWYCPKCKVRDDAPRPCTCCLSCSSKLRNLIRIFKSIKLWGHS